MKTTTKKVKFPELPPDVKAKTLYKADGYITAIAYDKYKVSFFIWDGVSSMYNRVLQFPVPINVSLPTNRKTK